MDFKILCFCYILCFLSCSCEQETDKSNEINSNKVATSEETKSNKGVNSNKVLIKEKLICPLQQTRVPFFSPSCKTTKDCSFLLIQNDLVCCKSRCTKGIEPPKPEPIHLPLFGMIDRVCPNDHMPEFLSIQECTVDADCGPRICCPERPIPGVKPKNYCRMGAPRLTRMPVIQQFLSPLKTFASYLQCTPPPPPFLDLFPKVCESTLDCFPSLCCQENGKKICRPPKKSLLALIAISAQRIGTTSIAKSFIERIS